MRSAGTASIWIVRSSFAARERLGEAADLVDWVEADITRVDLGEATWEVSIKHHLRRLRLPEEPTRYLPELRRSHGVDSLPLDVESTLYLGKLPALHRDPFDRMLTCQALVGGLVLMTPDEAITRYPVRTLW